MSTDAVPEPTPAAARRSRLLSRLLSRRRVLLVVAVTAVGCVGASLARPEPPATPVGTVEPVVRTVAVCPRPTTHATTTSALGLAVAAGAGSVSATVTDLEGESEPLLRVDSLGTSQARAVPEAAKTLPSAMRAEGSAAPLAAAGLVTRVTQGSTRGLSAVRCAPPASDSWFVGGGGNVGRRTTVWLANPDSTQAVVDLEVMGPDGPVPGHDTTGIVVAPYQQVGVRLDVVVPGNSRVALHVIARAGRVSAAVQDIATKGLIPRGADYVPASAPPSTQVVVAGVVGGSTGARLLQVAAPGDSDAIVNVRVSTPDGAFTPDDANLIEVPAGSVAQLDLAAVLADTGTASVILDSDVPVIAGVRTVLPRESGSAEVAYSAGSSPLAGPATFAPIPTGPAGTTALVLTAAAAEATATVTLIDPAGSAPVTRTVRVPAGSTVTEGLAEAANGAAVVVTPTVGSGPLQAALLLARPYAKGMLRSTVPLVSVPAEVLVPPVRPDPATGVAAG